MLIPVELCSQRRQCPDGQAAVTRQTVIQGDHDAIDGVWNVLDLGNTDWWRGWERQWRTVEK